MPNTTSGFALDMQQHDRIASANAIMSSATMMGTEAAEA
jgi:hypothetical protein